jgi:hypothetical protein
MRLKFVTVMAAIAALSFAAAGSAAAQPVGRGPAQVSGTRLATALLSPSTFWYGAVSTGSINSGPKLQSSRAKEHVPSLSCSGFENGNVYVADFGDTAAAGQSYANQYWESTYPDTIILGYEEALQFASASAAATLYNQAYAKYSACHTFSEGSQGQIHVQTLSVAKTTVSRDRAFVVHVRDLETGLTINLYGNTLYVLAGTNVYIFFNRSGDNDEPSPSLMSKLMKRAQALYPRGK